jgi:phosphatidylserine decarboxylase
MDILKHFLFKVHKEGIIYIIGVGVATLILSLIFDGVLLIGLLLTLAVALFFRDPERVSPKGDGLIIAPADGIVTAIEQSELPPEIEDVSGTFTRISIFLSVLDVHVNRVPASGVIRQLHYHAGKFLSATLDKSSDENERQTVLMETQNGKKICFVQIAGLIARRIVCDLNVDDNVQAGDRFGIIRFGSRMDVYLPAGVTPSVLIGQRMIGGETVLAKL